MFDPSLSESRVFPKIIIGNFYEDPNLIKRNLNLLPVEKILDKAEASFSEPNKNLIGIFIITNFRAIFKFEDEINEKKYNIPEDYFKFPLINIIKVEKIDDKKISFDAYPIEITLRDTRQLRFHIWTKNANNSFYYNLSDLSTFKRKEDLYKFSEEYNNYLKENPNYFNGWDIYSPEEEYQRQGITEKNNLNLKITRKNENYLLCSTYPKILVEPSSMSDIELENASKYRTKNRLPVLSYYYKGENNNNTNNNKIVTPSIWRSSQTKTGVMGNRKNDEDIKLLESMISLTSQLYIFDARPYYNALANRVNGGGFENTKHYSNVSLNFCEIENIHKARNSLKNLYQICLNNKLMTNMKFWSQIENTGWFEFIYKLLYFSNEISKTLQKKNCVLIHCSDGWDRSSQLITLSQILIDPYFRTFKGFAVLIEKDWLSFGHQFAKRGGINLKDEEESQISPIFLQFLDCVHQLIIQFPNSFEFNNDLLLFLAKKYNTNLYGTFMFDSEKERFEKNAKNKTLSVWSDVFMNISKYKNVFYDPYSSKILFPNYCYYKIKLWKEFFLENNIYVDKENFHISDLDTGITFTNYLMFFDYIKKRDVANFMNQQVKYEEMFKVVRDVVEKIKDNNDFCDQLSDDSKKTLEILKKQIEEIKIKEKEELKEMKDNNDDFDQ